MTASVLSMAGLPAAGLPSGSTAATQSQQRKEQGAEDAGVLAGTETNDGAGTTIGWGHDNNLIRSAIKQQNDFLPALLSGGRAKQS